MFSPLAITWVTLALVGQWSLVFLLGTFLLVKELPQRRNPFLMNMLFTTCLATFPPSLLFYAGQQDRQPVHWICVMQAVMLDGVAPMFSVALVVLLFKTWSDVRAIVLDRSPFTVTNVAKWTLLLAPYIALVAWCIASLVDSQQPTAKVGLNRPFVYCGNNSAYVTVGKPVGYFVLACGSIEFLFEVWIACLIFIRPNHNCRSKQAPSPSSASYRAILHLSIRISIFSLLSFAPIILVAINQANSSSRSLQVATQVIESMDAVVTFVVFGTQRSVLETWKILKPAADMEPSKDDLLNHVDVGV